MSILVSIVLSRFLIYASRQSQGLSADALLPFELLEIAHAHADEPHIGLDASRTCQTTGLLRKWRHQSVQRCFRHHGRSAIHALRDGSVPVPDKREVSRR